MLVTFPVKLDAESDLANCKARVTFDMRIHYLYDSASCAEKIGTTASLDLWIVFVAVSLQPEIEGRSLAGGVMARFVDEGIESPFAQSGKIAIRHRDGSDQNCR